MKKVWIAVAEAVALVIVASIVAFAFNSRSATGIDPFKQPAKRAAVPDTLAAQSGGFKVITLDEARSFVAGGGRIIDARTKTHFEEGHIPGALNLDYYELQKEMDSVLPLLSKDEEIMVYCEGVNCEASELLSKELYAMGFTKLLVFKGGFEEWSAAGMKVEKGGQQ